MKDWTLVLGHTSLIATIWLFLLAIIMPSVQGEHFISRFVVFTLTIFGGVGIYVILGVKLEEIRRKYGKKKSK